LKRETNLNVNIEMETKEKQTTDNAQKNNKNKSSSSSDDDKTRKSNINKKDNQIAVIRISGMVKVPKEIENALYRLKLRRKYSCVIIDTNNKSLAGLLKQVRFYVAYGKISNETQDKLIKMRGKKDKDGKLKTFFRLHPPRKGINSKLQYPKGVLGDNKKDINRLIKRML